MNREWKRAVVNNKNWIACHKKKRKKNKNKNKMKWRLRQ